jgi:hypothetical protein
LEFALNASQVALSAAEEEANVARVQLAEFDARVAGKIFNILVSFDAPILLMVLTTPNAALSLALMAQLEALKVVAGDAAGALNTRGDTLEDRLRDVPTHARLVALHGVRRGAAVALAIA